MQKGNIITRLVTTHMLRARIIVLAVMALTQRALTHLVMAMLLTQRDAVRDLQART
jgi:hypothetical protein